MTEPIRQLPPAGPLRRLAAMVYDALLVFVVLLAATVPAIPFSGQRAPDDEVVIHELEPVAQGWLFQLYLLAVGVAFFCWFWRKNGQTLGMQAWRLKILAADGGRISLWQCLLRLAGAAVSLACLGAGYWWAWIDRDGLTWHDRWSNSRVVVLPKQPH